MAVSVREANRSRADREWIERAYRQYLQDLGTGGTGVYPSLTVTGQQSSDLLEPWFHNERSTPLVILSDGRPAGFALVERTSAARGGPQAAFRLTEFFICAGQRRLGLGREAARLLFDRFAGQWLVVQSLSDHGATAFWRKVIAGYTRGRYRERTAGTEMQQTFDSAGRATRDA